MVFTMKLVTWNINGIRACKRSMKKVLDELDADIVCLQETKITRDMLDEPSAIMEGYNSYFSFSRKRSGYSGVANFCKDSVTPVGAEEGLSGLLTSHSEGKVGCYGNMAEFPLEELQALDAEGRAVMTKHQIQLPEGDVRELTIINVYVPRASANDVRWNFKQRFLALLQSRGEAILQKGSHVVVLGDINTAHKIIDHCDPISPEFMKIDSRQWMNQFLREEDRDPDLAPIEDRSANRAVTAGAEGGHFMDSFRFFHPTRTEAYTNWCTVTSARETNYGKRLDYILVDTGLKDYLVSCDIRPQFEGSDHCPVVLHLSCTPVPSKVCPPICTRLMPEFQGKQQKLHKFFSRTGSEKMATKQNGAKENGTKQNGGNGSDSSESQESERLADITKGEEDSDLSGSSQSSQLSQSSKLLQVLQSKQISASPVTTQSTSLPVMQAGKAVMLTNSEPATVSLKRPGSNKISDTNAKKIKKGRQSEGRQSSLLGFFKRAKSSAGDGSRQQNNQQERVSKYWQKSSEDNETTSENEKGEEEKRRQNGVDEALTEPQGKSDVFSLPEKPFTAASLALHCIPAEPSTPTDFSASPEKSIETPEGTGITVTEESIEKSEGTGTTVTERKQTSSTLWKGLLTGPPPAPLCKGHSEPCVLRTVKKEGPNKGKQFYTCARPEGAKTNKEARCHFFIWVSYTSSAGKKKR